MLIRPSTVSRHHRLAAGAALLALVAALPAVADTIRGRVFEDLNANARWDAGEPGLPGIQVSDGAQLVATDAEGRYALEVDDDCTVFAIKPSGFRPPFDEHQLPRFYYHHVPRGTADATYRFKGIAPTGPAPASVDFPFQRQAEPEKFTVALVADPQPYNTRELGYYGRATVSALAALRPAFGLALGDLVGDNLALHPLYAQVNARAGFPWFNVIGNHDLNYDAPDDRDADSSYRRVFGPSTYAFRHGRAHFLVFDNVYWLGRTLTEKGDVKAANYTARLRPEQLRFAAAFLATVPRDELVVVCTHIPMVHRRPDAASPFLTPEFPELLKLLSTHPHTLSVSGHMHYTYSETFGAADGYAADGGARHLHISIPTASGSWYSGALGADGLPTSLQSDGTPPGFMVLEIDGADYRLRYQALGRSSKEQMRVYAPEIVDPAQPAAPLQVNLYLGNADARVRYRVAGLTEWTELARETGLDPAFVSLRERSNPLAKAGDYRAMPAPTRTDHLWSAPLPAGLPPGVHRVEVEATDAFGVVSTAQTLVRVLAPADSWNEADGTSRRK